MKRTIAVIVTYNRHSLLVDCIEAIRAQTISPHEILVVNNGSADYTSVWLDNQTDIKHIYQENSGSAGGYHAGINYAYTQGYDFVWCMDDDGYPAKDALEKLLQNTSESPVLLNSAVIDKYDKHSFVFKTKQYNSIHQVKESSINGIAHPFNGTLIDRSTISIAGLPDAYLFYKGAETEYLNRITEKFNIPAKTITQSVHFHPPVISYNKEWDLKLNGSMYFMLRNQYQANVSKYKYKPIATMFYLGFIYSFIFAIIKTQKSDKSKKISISLLAGFDAMANNYSASPASIQQKINRQYNSSSLVILLTSVRQFILSVFVPSYSILQKATSY